MTSRGRTLLSLVTGEIGVISPNKEKDSDFVTDMTFRGRKLLNLGTGQIEVINPRKEERDSDLIEQTELKDDLKPADSFEPGNHYSEAVNDYEPFSDSVPINAPFSASDDEDRDPNYLSPSSSTSTSTSSDSSCSDDSDNETRTATFGMACPSTNSVSNDKNQIDNEHELEGKSVSDKINSTKCRKRNSSHEEKKNTRKRQRNELNWEKTKAKLLRNKGKEYTSSSKTKKIVRAREMKERCGDKCKFTCDQIDDDDRKQIFDEFYNLNDIHMKREFISKHTESVTPKYRYLRNPDKPRKINNHYYFTVRGQRKRICKQFFKNTLDINDRVIDTTIKKKTECGTVEQDNRGKHGKHYKIDDFIKQNVRQHIQSIPRVESHYLRSQCTTEFIEGSKTIAQLHRDYEEECKKDNRPAANYHLYNDIFNNEFNISFFKPKKDQCNLCCRYTNATEEEKKNLEFEYEQHQNEKCLSRVEMEKDKEKSSKNYIVACYDMQAVVQTPKGDTSMFYYRSKLNLMNQTITIMSKDRRNGNSNCYTWHEGHGGKGSIEICTCILLFLQQQSIECDSDDLEITLYSDNCGGQQKNRFLIGTLWYAVQTYKIKSITQKFLIVGHTQNSADSTHSTIEKEVKRFLRSGPLYVPDQYITLMRTARKSGLPYKVQQLTYEDFLDVKKIETRSNSETTYINSEGEKVLMNDMRVLKFTKSEPSKFFYKKSFGDDDFHEIQIKKRGRRNSNDETYFKIPTSLGAAYKSKIKLKDNKIKDLKYLLENGYINKCYAPFYYALF